VASNGTLAPGGTGTVGKLTIGSGTLSIAGSSAFDVSSGTSFDQIANGTSVTYGGALGLNFLGAFTPTLNETFALFNANASSSGNFSSITSNLDGYNFSFAPTTGVLTVTAVPEPASLALVGLSGLMLLRRRRA